MDSKVPGTLSSDAAQELGLICLNKCITKEQSLYEPDCPYSQDLQVQGKIKGSAYDIKPQPGAQGVLKPVRVLRDRVGAKLDHMVEDDVTMAVTELTDWTRETVVVVKWDGIIRICLDPHDLNQALRREHYPTPTLENIVTTVQSRKYSSTLDAVTGLWQVQLEATSTYLSTISTPHGW